MYFKKLEIFGFKSFADKTTLNFEHGITTIVGPNGCGKSNIFDAVRWGLGEQSVKELRGSSMEDVIFNGTETKPSLGFAEVSLTFANLDRVLPYDYDEITITRRLFRSGESEYMINKSVARLKDIQEMLMGTGIGAEAYSLIQQGKVDLVVSAKPEDRRQILDEASGITKYKSKKKEALNKLKHADDNLLRVNDIVVEVKRQIGSIERQANKAKRYKLEYEKLKQLEVCISQGELITIEKEKVKVLEQMSSVKAGQEQLNQDLEVKAEALTQWINQLSDIEQKINEIHASEIKLDGQIDLNNRQIGFNQQRIEDLDQSEKKMTEQKQQLIDRCQLQQKKIEEVKESSAMAEGTITYNENLLTEKRNNLVSLENGIKEAKRKIKEHEEKVLELSSSQVHLRNDLNEIMKVLQGALARKRRLKLEEDKVMTERDTVEQKLQHVEYQVNALNGTVNGLELARRDHNLMLHEIKTNIMKLAENIDTLEKKRLFLKSQKEFIEKLQTQYQEMPDPVVDGRLFTDNKPAEHLTGILGKVKQVNKISAGELIEIKERMVSSDKELYEIVCETKFIELDPQQISQNIEDLSGRIDQLKEQKESHEIRCTERMGIIKRHEDDMQSKRNSISILDAQRQDIIEEKMKLQGESELVSSELSEVKETLDVVKKKEEEYNYDLDTVTKELSWCQNDIKEKQNWIAIKVQEKEEAMVAITQLQAEIESDKDKLIAQQENLKTYAQTLDGWLEEIKNIDDEVGSFTEKRERCSRDNEEVVSHISRIREKKEALKGTFATLQTDKKQNSENINSLRATILDLEERGDKINQTLHEFDMKSQEICFHQKEIKDRLLQTYKIDLDQLPVVISHEETGESEGGQAVSADPQMNAQELERLKKRCESYGNVNLVAIEEYDELKQRFEFLTQQQCDLLEAKSTLMNTIRKINRTTRQMFMDTFTKVGEEFRIHFRMLFGGGEAQLVLLDPENVLESGIDIIARPPGKKLQNISLLSGGEKSLTAIALIFGVFKVNPSPFCVLDEIDAALDESNVGRFSYLLKEFSKIAQFIVITHNKKTIQNSDVIYGITMPEQGVSRMVSVKFSEDKQKQDDQVTAGV